MKFTNACLDSLFKAQHSFIRSLTIPSFNGTYYLEIEIVQITISMYY